MKSGKIEYDNSLIMITAGAILAVFLALICTIAAVIAPFSAVAGGGSDTGNGNIYKCQVSDDVERYRGVVEKYCAAYGIDGYVDIIMAIIQQESAGLGSDVMQSASSGYIKNPMLLTAEESIDAGVHYFSDCIKLANCESPSDIPELKLALQGYNFGTPYITWAIENYNGYSEKNAIEYSTMMAMKLALFSYGDSYYVKHVLRYYVKSITVITDSSASEIIEELEENNEADEEIWDVIYKGASLIGKVTYSMDLRQGDGRDNPTYLDCSSFTAWAFHKAGETMVPYSSTTATFIASMDFVDVSADDLRPGDIGLISATAGTGGANHVGIYCGKLSDGTKIWMHCTYYSNTSLTGNTSGAMFGAYTGFGYFRRLKKWNN